MGGLEAGQGWVVAVLALSSLLNAAYFLPLLYAAWFQKPPGEWRREHSDGRFEADWRLLFPSLVTAALLVAAGLFAGAGVSPLAWATLIAAREYLP
jgi:multicomponent Na+:H+ antiporter subunit D